MKKSGLKFYVRNSLILFSLLSLVFVSSSKVFGADTINVNTLEYTVLSPTVFILGGSYSGNTSKKPFTTYFEYKKDNSDFTSGVEETVKIVRQTSMDNLLVSIGGESGTFYSNPELKLNSDYYFRAVGYFNDAPDQKFYGNIGSLRTGSPYPANIPYMGTFNDQGTAITPYVAPVCKPPKPVYDILTGQCATSTTIDTSDQVTAVSSTVGTGNNTVGIATPAASDYTPPPSDSSASSTDLVPCGKEDSKGVISHPCGFDDVIRLINNVISYIFHFLVIPIAAILFAYAGFLLVTSGGSEEARSKAKGIFSSVVYGLVIATVAYLMVKTLLVIFGYNDATVTSWL